MVRRVRRRKRGYFICVCPELILGTENIDKIKFTDPFICVRCGTYHWDLEDNEESTKNAVRHCSCGNTKFIAHQVSYHDVVVDENSHFQRDNEIYESENPYGPYSCTKCGAEYEELDELDQPEANKGACVSC